DQRWSEDAIRRRNSATYQDFSFFRMLEDVEEQTGRGEGGIRTRDTLTSMPHFECGAFNHSATSPKSSHLTLGLSRRNLNFWAFAVALRRPSERTPKAIFFSAASPAGALAGDAVPTAILRASMARPVASELKRHLAIGGSP